MSQDTDLSAHSDYFAERASEERRMAMASADPNVRAVHLDMAQRYSELAKGLGASPLKLVVSDQRDAG